MKLSVLAAAGALLLGAAFSNAASVSIPSTMDQLVAAGSTGITIGDKTFTDFTVTGNVAANQISIIQAPGSDVGVEFQFNWTSTAANNMDTLLRYKVHVNDTAPTQRLITGVGLSFNGTTNAGNTDLGTNATVTETVSDLNGIALGQLTTFDAGSNFSSLNRDSALFVVTPATRDLMLAKDIQVHSTANGGTATISLVDNTFQQTPASPSSVPLPPAALMAISTLALGAFAPIRRRLLRRA